MMTRDPKTSIQLKRKLSGFTLIEMLMVLVIVALVLTFTATQFKQRQNLNAVDTTTIEMQQLLQAAQDYYRAKGYWPYDISLLAEAGSQFNLKTCGRLYVGSKSGTPPVEETPPPPPPPPPSCTPYNNVECMKMAPPVNCAPFNTYTLSFPTGYGSGNPNVTGTLPKAAQVIISTIAPNLVTAKALEAKLPNTTLDSNTDKISAAVYAPGNTQIPSLTDAMANKGWLMIKSVYTDVIGKNESPLSGNLGTKHYLSIQLPQCPALWTPGYEAALSQFPVNKDSSIYAYRGMYLCKSNYVFSSAWGGKTTELLVKTDRVSGGDWYSAAVMIITYCRPPNSQLPTGAWANNTYSVNKSSPNNCYFGPFKNSSGDVKS